MKSAVYTTSRDQLLYQFKPSLNLLDDEVANGQYNMVSAALVNYLPEIPIEQHEDIYRSIIMHKKLSILEQSSHEALEQVEMVNFNNAISEQLTNGPTIICTFHTGSYRLINLFLAKSQIPFTLVIGKDILEQEGAHFKALYGALDSATESQRFNIIDAEHPNVGLQMLRQLKKGHCLLLYMDGNTGAGVTTTKNDNRCTVNFLNQQLYARKGIAFLSHAADVPIVTVASYRSSAEKIVLHFFDPIYPDKSVPRKEFAEATTQLMYDLVSPIIRNYPEQWEAWLYIHKVAHIIQREEEVVQNLPEPLTEKLYLNSFQFGIFKVNGVPFIMRKNSYAFYQIDQQLYDILNKAVKEPIARRLLPENVFNQLYEQGVIHCI